MKSILIGYLIGNQKSGIDTYLLNTAATLCEAGYQIDFLTNKKNEYLENLLAEKGMGLFEIPSLKHPMKQYNVMKQIYKQKHYDIAYFNISEAFLCTGVIAAKKMNIKKIIVHSHNTGINETSKLKKVIRGTMHNFFKNLVLRKMVTERFACSELAAKWMFDKNTIKNKNYKIIHNAIQTEKFAYSEEKSLMKREELGIKDKFVIGHVSGFTPQKNVSFLIDVIDQAKNMNSNAYLVLVGEGRELDIVKEKVAAMHLEEYVLFLGKRNDVNDILQAFDAFVLPSLFEGAPVVAIEAQVSGLMVYLSDTITREVKLSEKCQYISLEKTPKEWAEVILSNQDYDREHSDFSNTTYCFDTKKQAEALIKSF